MSLSAESLAVTDESTAPEAVAHHCHLLLWKADVRYGWQMKSEKGATTVDDRLCMPMTAWCTGIHTRPKDCCKGSAGRDKGVTT